MACSQSAEAEMEDSAVLEVAGPDGAAEAADTEVLLTEERVRGDGSEVAVIAADVAEVVVAHASGNSSSLASLHDGLLAEASGLQSWSDCEVRGDCMKSMSLGGCDAGSAASDSRGESTRWSATAADAADCSPCFDAASATKSTRSICAASHTGEAAAAVPAVLHLFELAPNGTSAMMLRARLLPDADASDAAAAPATGEGGEESRMTSSSSSARGEAATDAVAC